MIASGYEKLYHGAFYFQKINKNFQITPLQVFDLVL